MITASSKHGDVPVRKLLQYHGVYAISIRVISISYLIHHPTNIIYWMISCSQISSTISIPSRTHSHRNMEVSENGGTPSSHPFIDGIFHEINHQFWGTPWRAGNLHWYRYWPWFSHHFPQLPLSHHLVVSTLWKISESVGRISNPIYGKMQNIPNHQAVNSGSQNMEFITINHHESP